MQNVILTKLCVHFLEVYDVSVIAANYFQNDNRNAGDVYNSCFFQVPNNRVTF